MDNQAFINTLEQIAKAWQLPLLKDFTANVKKKKLVSSRALLQSINAATASNLSSMLVTISFAFEEYGRYLDMKKIQWSEQPPIQDFIEWIKKTGIQKFKDPNPRPNKTTQRRLNEIAWGIAKAKSKRRRYKSRPWFQSTFYKSLSLLQEELLLGAADRTIHEIKESLNSRFE